MKTSMQAYFKSLTLVILLFVGIQQGYAIDINPGKDQTECPGTKIKLGGEPTAGPEPVNNYTFLWIAMPGGWTSTESNPEISVPDVKTVYTVRVTDADGFMCQKSVTITPVIVTGIDFDPTFLPADGKSTSQATAVSDTKGRSYEWTITGPEGTDATVGRSSGVVRASKQPATVKVKAQDTKAIQDKLETCFVEQNICIGDPDKCCPDVGGTIEFGPIVVKLTQPVKSGGSGDDGYCTYTTSTAGIKIITQGFFDVTYAYEVPSVTVAWKQKGTGDEMTFKEVKITWKGKASTQKYGPLSADLIQLDLQVNSEGSISGDVKFTINQKEDVPVGGMAVIAKGSSGTFTYKYKSSTSFEGDYDFGGISDVQVQLKKNKTVLASAKVSLTSKGDVNAEVTANGIPTFAMGSFTSVTLKKLNWKFSWLIKDHDLVFKEGKAELEVDKIENTKGKILIALELGDKTAGGTATFKDLIAFGCKVEGSIKVNTDYQFNDLTIQGNNISAKHPEFDAAFKITEFTIADGVLTSFNFKGEAKYKKLIFNISNAGYVQYKGLSISASLEIGNSGKLVAEDFIISAEGKISIAKIILGLERYPFKINGSLTSTTEGFKGTYTGSVEGGIQIGGTVELGAMETFNFCYFKLEMKSAQGFPVGPVIRINKLGGSFGYNCDEKRNPNQGTYLMGFILGLKDAANIMQVESEVTLVIGNRSAVFIEGSVNVPAKSPYYFDGGLKVNYFMGTNEVSGTTNAALKIPAGKGSIVKLSTGSMDFRLNEGGWSLKAPDIAGKIMNEVDMTGSVDVRGTAAGEGISGTVSGNINYSKVINLQYPKQFNGSNCATADNTDNALGFGITGDINLKFSGAFSSQVNAAGFNGSIKTSVAGSSLITVKWPCLATCANCVKTSNVSIAGTMELKHTAGTTTVEGELNFKGGDKENVIRHLKIEF